MVNKKARFGGFAGAQGYVFELSGGRLCLDFANTVDQRPALEPRELLPTYPELVSWARQTGVLAPREAKALERRALRNPDKARRALARAHTLRETIYQILSAEAAGRPGGKEPLRALQFWLSRAYSQPELRRDARYELDFRDDFSSFDGLLAPIARSAVDLLVSDELDRVRQCAAAECAWLFLDESKNRSRQWCDMSVCGNRAKARRFQARQRAVRRRRSRARSPSGGTR